VVQKQGLESSCSHQRAQRAFNPRAYETKGPRCTVLMFENFVKHRPKESKNSELSFFLAMIPVEKIKPNGVWYYNCPLDKKLFGKIYVGGERCPWSIRHRKKQIENRKQQITLFVKLYFFFTWSEHTPNSRFTAQRI